MCFDPYLRGIRLRSAATSRPSTDHSVSVSSSVLNWPSALAVVALRRSETSEPVATMCFSRSEKRDSISCNWSSNFFDCSFILDATSLRLSEPDCGDTRSPTARPAAKVDSAVIRIRPEELLMVLSGKNSCRVQAIIRKYFPGLRWDFAL